MTPSDKLELERLRDGSIVGRCEELVASAGTSFLTRKGGSIVKIALV
jgi:hypothetical protein